ncbi:MAG: tetratricopeptide repeat protein, partial [Planctomycetota bacterium]
LSSWASLWLDRYEYARAEPLYREASAIARKLDHPKQRLLLHNLAACLMEQDEHAEAEAIFRDLVEQCRERYGDKDRCVPNELRYLGEAIYRAGRLDEAEELLRETVALSYDILGRDDFWTAAHETVLAECLTHTRQFDEAEKLLLHSVSIVTRDDIRDVIWTRRTIRALIELYEEWGKLDQAARVRAELAPRESSNTSTE